MFSLLLLLTLAPNSVERTTSTVGKAFIDKVLVGRDDAAAAGLAHPDLFFRDPTAALVAPGLVEGIRGLEKVLAKMKSFGVGSVEMEPRYQFSAGAYHCFVGTFNTKPDGAAEFHAIPFMTVLQVEGGLVTNRTDYGDYDSYLPEGQRVDGVVEGLDHPMVMSAKAYVEAYGNRDFDLMAGMWADEVVFQDRTAAVFGIGDAVEGRAKLLPMLESAVGDLLSFELETDYMFFHGDHAVFAGRASYTLPGASVGLTKEAFTATHPLAVVLQFKDGRVVRHDDFADYGTFYKLLEAANKTAE